MKNRLNMALLMATILFAVADVRAGKVSEIFTEIFVSHTNLYRKVIDLSGEIKKETYECVFEIPYDGNYRPMLIFIRKNKKELSSAIPPFDFTGEIEIVQSGKTVLKKEIEWIDFEYLGRGLDLINVPKELDRKTKTIFKFTIQSYDTHMTNHFSGFRLRMRRIHTFLH